MKPLTKTLNPDILLIEDNDDDAEIVQSIFKKNNIENILHIKTGEEALDYLLSKDGVSTLTKFPKLILLDINLPGMNGLNVLRRMRKNTKTDKLPVFVFTSSTNKQDTFEAYNLGVTSYINKHTSFEKFEEAIMQTEIYLHQYKVLILEDNSSDAEIISYELENSHVDCLCRIAGNKAEYTKLLIEFKPDIVFSDYDLPPNFDAIQAIRILKGMNLDIPFVLVTGKLAEEFASGCMVEGMDDYLLKEQLKRLPLILINTLRKKKLESQNNELIKKLQASEAVLKNKSIMLSEAQRIAMLGNWKLDIATGYMTWSDEMYSIYSLTPATFHNSFDDFLKPVHPDDKHAIEHLFKELLSHERRCDHEFRIILNDGTIRTIFCSGEPSYNENNKLVSFIGTIQDITERKRLEDKNALLAFIVLSSNDAIISKTIEGIITSWNRGAENIFGYSAAEILGRDILMLIPPENHADERLIMEKIRKGEKVEHFETQRFKKDGTTVPVSVTISPVKDAQGNIVGASSILTDETERKKAEAEREEMNAALKEIQWLLVPEDFSNDNFVPVYGDITKHNTNRTILDSVGTEMLESIVNDFMKMLGTSSAVYEKNGDYAMGIFSSGWCRSMDQASYKLCNTNDVNKALHCGKWHCHESCWNEASRPSIESGKPTDIACAGGIHLYAVPIIAGGEIVGSINFGYGSPPETPEKINELSAKYSLNKNQLTQLAKQYKKRPQFIIDYAKTKLQSAAYLIGLLVEREKAETELKESEKRFSQLIESLPQLFWTCRVDGPCDYLSRQWVEYTGIPENQQLGYGWLNQLHPDDRERTISEWMEKVKTQEPFDMEFSIRKYNGEFRWFKTRAVPMYDSNGNLVKWFGSNTDIDEIKKAEQEIRQLNQNLEVKVKERTAQYQSVNKELESFSYSVSHDLRAPLRAVDSYAQILIEDHSKNLEEDGKLILQNIKYNTRKMGLLIDELLAFSRLERAELERRKIDMNELVRAAIEEVNHIHPNRASIHVSQLPVVYADYSLLYRVILNLLSNAIKYSSKKEQQVIEIFAENENAKNVFVVKDNGAGFDMRFADKLFGVFQRLHSETEFEGNGVGLAIVKRIINKHGGEVWGKGKVNEGASFYFALN